MPFFPISLFIHSWGTGIQTKWWRNKDLWAWFTQGKQAIETGVKIVKFIDISGGPQRSFILHQRFSSLIMPGSDGPHIPFKNPIFLERCLQELKYPCHCSAHLFPNTSVENYLVFSCKKTIVRLLLSAWRLAKKNTIYINLSTVDSIHEGRGGKGTGISHVLSWILSGNRSLLKTIQLGDNHCSFVKRP